MKRSKTAKEILVVLKEWQDSQMTMQTAYQILDVIEELGMRPPFVETYYIANSYDDGYQWEPESE